MGVLGAHVPSVTLFMLKKLQGWKDTVEPVNRGRVVVRVDEQDLDA